MGKRRWKLHDQNRPIELAPQAEVDRLFQLIDQVSPTAADSSEKQAPETAQVER